MLELLLRRAARTYPDRLAIAYGDYELDLSAGKRKNQQTGQCPHEA